jgi:hypothetical protein
MFAKDSSNKKFLPPRHEATKFNYNKPFTFVSWCLGGYSFRFIRVGFKMNRLFGILSMYM